MEAKDMLVGVLLFGGGVIAVVSYLISEMSPAPGPSSSLPPPHWKAACGFGLGVGMVFAALLVGVLW